MMMIMIMMIMNITNQLRVKVNQMIMTNQKKEK
jgi:hypothetical protein